MPPDQPIRRPGTVTYHRPPPLLHPHSSRMVARGHPRSLWSLQSCGCPGRAAAPVPQSFRFRGRSGCAATPVILAIPVTQPPRSHRRSDRMFAPVVRSLRSWFRLPRLLLRPGPAQSRFRSPHGPAVLRPGLQPPSPHTTPRSGTSASVGPPEASVPTQRMPPTQSPIFPLPLPPPPCHRPRERYLREGSRAFPHPIELQLYTGRGLLPYRLAPDTTTSSGSRQTRQLGVAVHPPIPSDPASSIPSPCCPAPPFDRLAPRLLRSRFRPTRPAVPRPRLLLAMTPAPPRSRGRSSHAVAPVVPVAQLLRSFRSRSRSGRSGRAAAPVTPVARLPRTLRLHSHSGRGPGSASDSAPGTPTRRGSFLLAAPVGLLVWAVRYVT
ncbi:hypothetical protein B0H15DRAFT_1017721 [Mycena belliarum]|uniref:Uncharacterized protein n=1 Tax=Mycena belliarum TaxID=1033014 RepID=A0AAD6UGK8_9AGAR|nr:hypothetical protein B0H15DRAFT_1017721 [Mycena belliae]